MGVNQQDQQKTIIRNRLAENAKRILNTKSFAEDLSKIEKVAPKKSNEKTQEEHLKQGGFEDPQLVKTLVPPASYEKKNPSGALEFTYKKQPYDSVCKGDPPVKNLQGARYNIITGSI